MSVTKNITRAYGAWADLLTVMADHHSAIDTAGHEWVWRDGSNFYQTIPYKHWNGSDFVYDSVDNILMASGSTLGMGAGKGRFIFNDLSTDKIEIENANLVIGHSGTTQGTSLLGIIGTAASNSFSIDSYSTTNTDGGYIYFQKSGSATKGTLAETGDIETLGIIIARGVNSSGASANGSGLGFIQDGSAGASYIGSHIEFYTSDTTNGQAERMRLTSGGFLSVGGLAAPDSLMHLWTATAGTVSAPAKTLLTIESNDDVWASFLTPANKTSGLKFLTADATGSASILHYGNALTLTSIHDSTPYETASLQLNPSCGSGSQALYLTVASDTDINGSALGISPHFSGAGSATAFTGIALRNPSLGSFTYLGAFNFESAYVTSSAPTGTTTKYLNIVVDGAAYRIQLKSVS